MAAVATTTTSHEVLLKALQTCVADLELQIKTQKLAAALTADKFPTAAVDAIGKEVIDKMVVMTPSTLKTLTGGSSLNAYSSISAAKMPGSFFKGQEFGGHLFFAVRVAPTAHYTLAQAKVFFVYQLYSDIPSLFVATGAIVLNPVAYAPGGVRREYASMETANWKKLAELLQGKAVERDSDNDKSLYKVI